MKSIDKDRDVNEMNPLKFLAILAIHTALDKRDSMSDVRVPHCHQHQVLAFFHYSDIFSIINVNKLKHFV